MESDTHISQESSQKITCPFCGAIVQAKDEFCTNCGSDLTNSQSSSEAPQKKLTNAKNVKPESIQSVRQEKQIVLSIAAVLLIALGFFGYRGSTSTKKGFALSGAAGAGEESQNPSVNSRAAAPSESSESPSVNMPSLNADPVIAERIESLKKKFEAETDSEKKTQLAITLSNEFLNLNRFDLAGQYSLRAAETSQGGKNATLWIRAANLLDDAKGYFIAASCYAKALELDPSNTDVRVDYAICKLNMNDAKGGLEEMKRAVEQNPKHQKANLNIGILYAQSEEWSLVKKHWTIAYNLDKASDAGKRADELLAKYTEKFKK